MPAMHETDFSHSTFQKLLRSNRSFLVVNRNCGLGDNLLAIAHGWLYCQKANRDLIVCLTESRYLSNPEENAGHTLFEFPETVGSVKIWNLPQIPWKLRRLLTFDPAACRIYRIHRKTAYRCVKFTEKYLPQRFHLAKDPTIPEELEQSLVSTGNGRREKFLWFHGCHCNHISEIRQFLKCIRPSKSIAERLKLFLNQIPKKFIGLHVRYYSPEWVNYPRYGDYWTSFDDSLRNICQLVSRVRSQHASELPILLCTNDERIEQQLRIRIDNIITLKKEFGSNASLEIFDRRIEDAPIDAVIEMFALTSAACLIRYPETGSWFSEIAATIVPQVII